MDNKIELCYIPGMKKNPAHSVDDVFWKCVKGVSIAKWKETEYFSWVYSWVKTGEWSAELERLNPTFERWTRFAKKHPVDAWLKIYGTQTFRVGNWRIK